MGESQLCSHNPHLREQCVTITLSAVDRHARIVGTQTPPSAWFVWHSEDDTHAFALRLAALPGLPTALITLEGDLGAGKTTLVRHLLGALGVQGRIKSPTYAVVEPYQLPGLDIWHFDFYRFSDPQEWEDAGFRDIFASNGLKLAEWPQKVEGLLPPTDLALTLTMADGERRSVTAVAGSPLGLALLEGLA